MWIFISHSTATSDQAGLDRLEAVSAALKSDAGAGAGYDVLLDLERLQPSSQWRSELDEWIAQCHAAVLMLTPKALDSPWVLKEATILAHRAARDPHFFLFPVLLDGVNREDLARKDCNFSPIYLEAIQHVVKTDPISIAASVKGQLSKLEAVPATPLDELASDLETLLKTGDLTKLERVCQLVTGKSIGWAADESRAARCAREIARAVVRRETGGYLTAGALVQDLLRAGLTKEAATRALNLAAPLWVEGVAAAPLADVAGRNLGAQPDATGAVECWATAINGALVPQFTADMYLRRAYLPGSAILRSIEGGESELRADDLIQRIRDEVRNRDVTLRGASRTTIDHYLAQRTTPYFIVLPPPLPDEATLLALQAKYRRVTFIAHTGDDLPPAASLPVRMVPLLPPVDLDREMGALQDYNDTDERIRKA